MLISPTWHLQGPCPWVPFSFLAVSGWCWWPLHHPCLFFLLCLEDIYQSSRMALWLKSGQENVSVYDVCHFQTGSYNFCACNLPVQMTSRMSLTISYWRWCSHKIEGAWDPEPSLGGELFNWLCFCSIDEQENKLLFS